MTTTQIQHLLGELFQPLTEAATVPVFRGQGNIKWEPLPTLYRRLLAHGYRKNEITEQLVLEFETDLICESNGLGFYQGDRLSTMVKLQHHGGATRLLDVSRDPLTALWFACDEQYDNLDGCVLTYHADPRITASAELISNWDQLSTEIVSGSALVYFPHRDDERVKAQAAGFLTTALAKALNNDNAFINGTPRLRQTALTIPKELKPELRSYMESSQGMRDYTVYPDFDGYARSHGVSHNFHRDREHMYRGENGLFPDRFTNPVT